jgi:hypothetical protein
MTLASRLGMRLAWVLGALVLAGCAFTPAQVIEKGEKAEYSSPNPPRQLAVCIVRNVEERVLGARPALREREAANTYQVNVEERLTGMMVAVVQVDPLGEGSFARIASQSILPDLPPAQLVPTLTRGC